MIEVYLYGKLKNALKTEHYKIKKGTWVLLGMTLGYENFTLIATDDFTQGNHTAQSVPINLCSYHDSVDHNIDLEDVRISDKRVGIEYVIDEFVNDSYFDVECEPSFTNDDDDDYWDDDVEEDSGHGNTAEDYENGNYDIFFKTVYDKYQKDQLSFGQAAKVLGMSEEQFKEVANNYAGMKFTEAIRNHKRTLYGEED